jgi:hypothetical protein
MKMQTLQGVIHCTVPEFDPNTYKGLRSGIGKERRSSKHFGCKKECCVKMVVKAKRTNR